MVRIAGIVSCAASRARYVFAPSWDSFTCCKLNTVHTTEIVFECCKTYVVRITGMVLCAASRARYVFLPMSWDRFVCCKSCTVRIRGIVLRVAKRTWYHTY